MNRYNNVAVLSYRGDAERGFMLGSAVDQRGMRAGVLERLRTKVGYKVATHRDIGGHLITKETLVPGQTVKVSTAGILGSGEGQYYEFSLAGADNAFEDIRLASETDRLLVADVIGFNNPLVPTTARMSYKTGLYNMFMPISHVSRYASPHAATRACHISRSLDESVEGIVFGYDEDRYLGKFSIAGAQDLVLAGLRENMGTPIDAVLTEIMKNSRGEITGYQIWHRGLIKGFLHISNAGLNGADPPSLLGTAKSVIIQSIIPFMRFFDIIVEPAPDQFG